MSQIQDNIIHVRFDEQVFMWFLCLHYCYTKSTDPMAFWLNWQPYTGTKSEWTQLSAEKLIGSLCILNAIRCVLLSRSIRRDDIYSSKPTKRSNQNIVLKVKFDCLMNWLNWRWKKRKLVSIQLNFVCSNSQNNNREATSNELLTKWKML